jgi:hypothetical protein
MNLSFKWNFVFKTNLAFQPRRLWIKGFTFSFEQNEIGICLIYCSRWKTGIQIKLPSYVQLLALPGISHLSENHFVIEYDFDHFVESAFAISNPKAYLEVLGVLMNRLRGG